jgi:cyclic beta-1,2-glucan synthetase
MIASPVVGGRRPLRDRPHSAAGDRRGIAVAGALDRAPAIAFLLSRPVAVEREILDPHDRAFLTGVALRTWRYFDVFVGPADHALPPDNVQIGQEPIIAHRTSPTNIAMSLLATVSAGDLGFIDVDDMAARLDATLSTVERLEKFDGHLLNWYDTATLAPLEPRYVSTVDSGNLAGALVALASGWPDLAPIRASPLRPPLGSRASPHALARCSTR